MREAAWRYRRWHLILIAQNLTGWHNLLRITSEAYACMTPESRVLTADLRWVPAGELKLGEKLLGYGAVDTRQMLPAEVTHTGIIKRHVYTLKLSDGTRLRCSSEHPWLTMYGTKSHGQTQVEWKTTDEIVKRFNKIRDGRSGVGRQPIYNFRIARYFYPWETDESRDGGYIAGVFDGEGHICPSGGKETGRGGGLQLGMTQKDNVVLRKVREILEKTFPLRHGESSDGVHRVCRLDIKGGRQAQLSFLGRYRPQRLIDNFVKLLDDEKLGIIHKLDAPTVVDVIDGGDQDVVALSTSTGTYFAEGFGAHNSGFYQNPCVDDDLLERYGEGLICSASCMLGPMSFLIENGSDRQVAEFVKHKQKVFGDRFWVELMPHDWDRQVAKNVEMVSQANRYGIGYYATVDAHYPEAGWADTQKIVVLISTNTTMDEARAKNAERIANGDEIYELGHEGLHLMDEAEVRQRFANYHSGLPEGVVDEAIKNTHVVAATIDPFLMDRSLKMPKVTKTIEEAERIVMDWCQEGLTRVGKQGVAEYEKQLEYERGILKSKGVFDYFVLVGRLVRWAKSTEPMPPTEEDPDPQPKRPIRVGSGRGSAAGSLISYLSGITTIDPIAHKLKFERFLNPGRKGLPDIDIDFESRRRNEVKEYLARIYGRQSVADVVAYATFAPRAALQNVTKTIYGYQHSAYEAVVKVTDQIDPVHDSNLEEMRDKLPDLDAFAKLYPDIWLHATRLENEGNPFVMRMSKHAGGVIIVPGKITDYMGSVRASAEDESIRTAWSETPRFSICDEFGLVKIDVLSVTGMDQQQMVVDSVEARTGEVIDLDELPPLRDPYDVDPKVMEAFAKHTLGVNQFEGDHITTFMRQLKPENAIDLAAANALYRPGPIGEGGPWSYAKRKNGEESYSIPDILKPVIAETYGVLAFQEQVMDLFSVLVGYDAGQADDIRKIIAKLYRLKGDEAEQILNERKDEFITAATKIVGQPDAERLWGEILPFSGYSFNRAHAGGYSIMAYQDMWEKVYYPLDFYSALLTLEPKKALRAAREARHFNVSLMPPDVNISGDGFTVDFDASAIRFGLIGINGVGDAAANQVMQLRPFASVADFEERNSVKYTKCNAGHRKYLIAAGALDSLGARDDWTDEQRAEAELERLGMALTASPLGDSEQIVRDSIHTEEDVEALPTGERAVVGGTITSITMTKVKRGRQEGREMCFLAISLGLDSWKCTCFPDVYDACRDYIEQGNSVMINGRKDDRGSIIVKAMMSVHDFVDEMTSTEPQGVAA